MVARGLPYILKPLRVFGEDCQDFWAAQAPPMAAHSVIATNNNLKLPTSSGLRNAQYCGSLFLQRHSLDESTPCGGAVRMSLCQGCAGGRQVP